VIPPIQLAAIHSSVHLPILLMPCCLLSNLDCPAAALCLCILEGQKTEFQLEATSSAAAHACNPCSSYAHLRCLCTLHQNACVISIKLSFLASLDQLNSCHLTKQTHLALQLIPRTRKRSSTNMTLYKGGPCLTPTAITVPKSVFFLLYNSLL